MTAPWPGQRPGTAAAAGHRASPDPATPPSAGPDPATPPHDPAAEAEIASVMRLVTEVRRFRSDQGLRARAAGSRRAHRLGRQRPRRSRGEHPRTAAAQRPRPGVPRHGFGAGRERDGGTGHRGRIDVAAERRRTEKDLAAARAEAEQAQRKLANESFLARAPAEVVAKTRDRLAGAEADIDRLTGRLAALPRDDA